MTLTQYRSEGTLAYLTIPCAGNPARFTLAVRALLAANLMAFLLMTSARLRHCVSASSVHGDMPSVVSSMRTLDSMRRGY